ncbi:unnamed protein product [Rhizophagus irregularis]|nr:unnamed protein product [Rhizophagus irregularis]
MSTNNNNTTGLPKFRIERVDNNNSNKNNKNTLKKFYKNNKSYSSSGSVVGLPKLQVIRSNDFEDTKKEPQSEAEFLLNLLEAPQPETLITKLLPYQKQGLGWMLSNEHLKEPTIDEEVQFWIQKEDQTKKILNYYNTAVRFSTIIRPNLTRGERLADDMGLGKMIQTIALIASKPEINLDSTYSKTTLIVAPLSVLENWVEQIKMHVKKGSLSYYVFHDSNRNNDPEFLKNYDIIITTYTILAQSDIKERSGLFAIKWLRVILDEGHIICTRSTKQSIAACNLDAERRWILTGTPIMNELDDICSLIKFLRFTPFDSLEMRNNIFNNKTIKSQYNNSHLNNLRSLMKTICLRKTKDMKFNGCPIVCLPTINYYGYKIKFKTDERKIYDKMESDTKEQFRSWKESRNGNLKNNYVTFLEMILRLRQICNHTQLLCKRQINQINGIDNKEEIGNLNDFKISSKIEALVEFLNQNNDDDKSVVFSQ